MELHKECCKYLDLSTIDLDTLIEINDYYENERYPGPKYTLPTMDEIDRNVKLCDFQPGMAERGGRMRCLPRK